MEEMEDRCWKLEVRGGMIGFISHNHSPSMKGWIFAKQKDGVVKKNRQLKSQFILKKTQRRKKFSYNYYT